MMRQVACAAVLVCAVLAVPGWCEQESKSPPPPEGKGHYYLMLGRFLPTDGDRSGRTAIGIQYLAANPRPYFAVEYANSSHSELVQSTPVELEDQAITAVIGKRVWRGRWYVGGAGGLSRIKHEVPAATGIASESETNLAWEVAVGTLLGRRGMAELRYIDWGDDAVRGFVGAVGIRY